MERVASWESKGKLLLKADKHTQLCKLHCFNATRGNEEIVLKHKPEILVFMDTPAGLVV